MTEFRLGIRRSATGERKYVRRTEGRSHFAHLRVSLDLRPGEHCRLLPGARLGVPKDCIDAAEAALVRKISGGSGMLPMHAFALTIVGGSWMQHYSNPEAFAIAAEMALEDGLQRAGRVMLEPWTGVRMKMENERLAEHLRTLTEVFGEVSSQISWSGHFVIKMEVPVRAVRRVGEMFQPRGQDTDRNELELFVLPMNKQFQEAPLNLRGVWPPDLDGWT